MSVSRGMRAVAAAVSVGVLTLAPAAWASECKEVHADLVEQRSTTGCVAPATVCFFGEVDGNHGLHGTTYFSSDSARIGPATAPGWISYSGLFHYQLDDGTLVMRETGSSSPAVVNAYQEVVGGTGRLEGATGYFFVSGFKSADGMTITTRVVGELCMP